MERTAAVIVQKVVFSRYTLLPNKTLVYIYMTLADRILILKSDFNSLTSLLYCEF
jgi:hypothetical protein